MTVRTPEVVEEIVQRVSEGEPLRAVCRDPDMPAWRTVYAWMQEDKDFAERMARARDLGQEALFQQCIDIADDEQHDWVMTKKGSITNEVAIGRAKLQVWTRLQLLARWNPKKYAEGQKIEHSGEVTTTTLAARMRKRRDGQPPEGVDDLV